MAGASLTRPHGSPEDTHSWPDSKTEKRQFGMCRCICLGNVVGNCGVRAFLGLRGYYRKFIPDIATIAVPLTDLTRKNASNRVLWNAKSKTAFRELKARLCSSPVLRSPDFSQPFILQTDASDRGVGAVLSQVDDK